MAVQLPSIFGGFRSKEARVLSCDVRLQASATPSRPGPTTPICPLSAEAVWKRVCSDSHLEHVPQVVAER